MKLIVNTNRIIAALIKDSTSRKLINHLNAELMVIDFIDEEINEHKEELMSKSKINESEFNLLLTKLKERLVNIDKNIISTRLEEAKEVMDKIDKDDTYFIAAALATNSDIWSDDNHFQKQNKIKIWRTEELIKKLDQQI